PYLRRDKSRHPSNFSRPLLLLQMTPHHLVDRERTTPVPLIVAPICNCPIRRCSCRAIFRSMGKTLHELQVSNSIACKTARSLREVFQDPIYEPSHLPAIHAQVRKFQRLPPSNDRQSHPVCPVCLSSPGVSWQKCRRSPSCLP